MYNFSTYHQASNELYIHGECCILVAGIRTHVKHRHNGLLSFATILPKNFGGAEYRGPYPEQ